MIFRVLTIVGLLAVTMTTNAFASVQFICQITQGNPTQIANKMNATILESTVDGTYLMSADALPTNLPKGVSYVEPDTAVTLQPTAGAIFNVPSTTSANWYGAQPAMQLIRLPYAQFFTTGAGTIIADINSAVDYTHPALAGHLIPGADFVKSGSSSATLNQSSTAFLDQSSTAFLD